MTPTKPIQITQNEISHLAYLNWEKDGRPRGRDRDYWLEAECQLKATAHLLAADIHPLTKGESQPLKNKALGIRKTPARPALARAI